jgi:DNA-binding beta-propeller fold protein YncE
MPLAHDPPPQPGDPIGAFRDGKVAASDPDGFLYVIDAATSEISKLTPAGKVVATAGGYGWSDAAMDRPSDVSAPNGIDVYVADYGNHRILRLDRNLNVISSLSLNDADGRRLFGYPKSVACSGDGILYIVDGENQRIVSITTGNQPDRIFGDVRSGEGRLAAPTKIRVGPDHTIYVLDGTRVVLFDIYGNFLKAIPVGGDITPCSIFLWKHSFGVCDPCSPVLVTDSGFIRIPGIRGTDSCSIRDCTAEGEVLFLLTSHSITPVRFHTEAATDSGR